MNTKRKYFLLILLLILPVFFYSLSELKISKSLGDFEKPEILEEYANDGLKITADATVRAKTAGYYLCYNKCVYKKVGEDVTFCGSVHKDKHCGKSVKLTLNIVNSSNAAGGRAEIISPFKRTCKTDVGKNGCTVTNLKSLYDIKDKNYNFDFWATDKDCKNRAKNAYSDKATIENNATYYLCLKKKGGSDNPSSGSEKKFKVIFNANSGKFSSASGFVLSSDKRTATKECTGSCTLASPKNVSRDGYEFLGWCQGSTTCQKPYTFFSVSHLKQTFYYAQWKKKDSTPPKSNDTPVQPVKTDDTVKTTINDDMYVLRDTGILNCGDKVRVTTCTSTGNNTTKVCDVTIVNNRITSTQVEFSNLTYSYDSVPASCREQTLYTTKTVPEYTSTSQIGSSVSSNIPCGTMVTVENISTSCSYGSGKNYCEAKLNDKTVYIQYANLADAKPDNCEDSGSGSTDGKMCVYNSSENDYKWIEKNDASKNYANGYKDTDIVNESDCKDPNKGEKSCTTSSKATNVTEIKKIINICYEKKNDSITNDVDINTMYTCASDYTKNPAKLNEDTCKNIKNGTCHKSYVISCSSAKRPGIEIASSLLNQGVGTITIRGRKVAADVKSYYLDEQKVPSNDSLWKDFSDANTVAYEQKPAGLYYAWVRDVNGLISRPMYAIVHDADINNTLKSLDVSDANDVALTLRAIDGATANTDEIMPSNYALLSNRLNTDSTLAVFDSLSMGYEIDVNSSKISVYATLTSKDAKYVEGYEPRTVDLDYGRNTILIKIESNSGKVRTYTIIANRTDDRVNNNLLSDLTVSKGNISFDPYVTNYDINVGKNVKSVNVNANLASDTSAFVSGFEPRSVDLNNDVTTAIIKTISETGSTRSYVLTFNKTLDEEEEVSNSALLDTLFIRGTVLGFNKEVFDYSVTIPYEYSFTEVYAFPESDNATVEISGNANLQIGANNIEIKVTNKNKTNVYNVTVNRKEPGLEISNDVTLSSLNVKGYKLDFKPDVLDYQVKIKRERSLIITATPTSNRSDIYMYGNNDLTGFSTVRVKVVAENGNTNIYSIDIQKDSYNKVLEVTATVIGCVIFLGAAIIIVVRKKHKKMKEYLGK